MTMIKAVIFDLDNTLIDFNRMKEEACRAAVTSMITVGLKMDRQTAYTKLMRLYYTVGIESDRAFTTFLESEGQFTHKRLAAAINAYLKTKDEFLEPYPNVKVTLKTLKKAGIMMVIVTDAPKTKAYQRLLALGIEAYFDFVVGFEDTRQKKRSGLPLKLAIEKLRKKMPNLQTAEILMVGDSIHRDLLPAKKLGLKSALAKYGQYEAEEGQIDYELTDISDVLSYID